MADAEHWPPSKRIHPLFIAFHITPHAKDGILSERGINYLKMHEPIGCRDRKTQSLLQQNGISAYFSGCLTLTLNRSYSCNGDRDNIYFVDPQITCPTSLKECIHFVYNGLKNIKTISKLYQKIDSNYFIKHNNFLWKLICTLVFYNQYSSFFSDELLVSAQFISHEKGVPDSCDISESFKYANSLLEKYACASLVITSRIHCALPCTSFQTPCLFVDREGLSQNRFEGLVELLNVLKLEDNVLSPVSDCVRNLSNLDNGKFTLTSKIIPNMKYTAISEKLEKAASDFFKSQ